MLTTHTAVLASGQGIVGMSQEIFSIIVVVGGLAALGLGIVVGLKKGYQQGIGAAIGAVVGGIILSLIIGNIAGFRDSGSQELKQRGIVSVYGQ